MSTRAFMIDPYNRELTRGQMDAFALGLFSNAHPHELPGYMYGDVWKFYRWSDLTDTQRDEWRQKALRVYATLVAYGQRLVDLDRCPAPEEWTQVASASEGEGGSPA